MRVELTQLLAERPIVHPTKIEAISWSQAELRIKLGGYPWWLNDGHRSDEVGSIHLVFRYLADGSIHPRAFDFEDDEALEGFEVLPLGASRWALPQTWSIYCSAPVPDPLRIYVSLHDFLSRQAAFMAPEDFLNQARQIGDFLNLAASQSFLLGRGPDCIRDLICDELQRQGVAHNVVRTHAGVGAKFHVRFGTSSFLCDEAFADIEP